MVCGGYFFFAELETRPKTSRIPQQCDVSI